MTGLLHAIVDKCPAAQLLEQLVPRSLWFHVASTLKAENVPSLALLHDAANFQLVHVRKAAVQIGCFADGVCLLLVCIW